MGAIIINYVYGKGALCVYEILGALINFLWHLGALNIFYGTLRAQNEKKKIFSVAVNRFHE